MLPKRRKETAGDNYGPGRTNGFALSDDPVLAAKPVILSFAQRGENPPPEETWLHQSCKECGQELRFETIPATNLETLKLFKPGFIKFKLVTLGRPVLWLDPGTRISGPVHLPEGDWDIATASISSGAKPPQTEKSPVTVFRPTIAALRLIELWEQLGSEAAPARKSGDYLFNYAKKALHGRYVETGFTAPLTR